MSRFIVSITGSLLESDRGWCEKSRSYQIPGYDNFGALVIRKITIYEFGAAPEMRVG